MKFRHVLYLSLLAMNAFIARAEDFLDRVDEELTFSAHDDQVRARLSGLMDLEFYHFSDTAPGLIFTDDDYLLNPRLTLFFDAQLGSQVYVFAQGRLDRGFDPADDKADARLDEYAVRWTPWTDGRFNVQVGKFATVVGNWTQRHLSWENPFINGPLIYESMTAIYDSEVPESRSSFLEGITEEKYEYNPVIWGASYASGVAVSGRLGEFDYAFEWKNSPLSSRPESWNLNDIDLSHGTVSGRAGWRPDQAWNLGLSASEGAWLVDAAEDQLPHGRGMNDYKEIVLGQDISYAWAHWQVWAEMFEARFQVPHVGNADILGYYVEAKYKFTPQLFGALRWNQMLYNDVPDELGHAMPWGHDEWRLDAAMTYRFTPHMQMKVQYSLQHEDHAEAEVSHLVAAQFTVRF